MIRPTIPIIVAFCTNQIGSVSTKLQQPITQYYAVNADGSHQSIRLALSWANTGTCPQSQLSISPSQHAGRLCRTIFGSILSDCKTFRMS